jgi:DNA-binding NtrC family response regulator
MKTNTFYIGKKSSSMNSVVREAVKRTGHVLETLTNSREAFRLLQTRLHDIDLIFIDVDPGLHAMAILEALAGSENPPRVIVITGFEESDMTPIAHRHGATACIAKPFTAAELASLIRQVSPLPEPPNSWSSDRWGHPHRCHRQITSRRAIGCARSSSGAASKFSAASSISAPA